MSKSMTAAEFMKIVGDGIDMTPAVVKAVVHEVANVATTYLKKNGEFRIPYVCKIVVKKIPAKKHAEGDYTNPFTRETTHKRAWTTPAKTRVKAVVASQIKKEIV